MPEPIRPDGRKVREYNQEVIRANLEIYRALAGALRKTDPVEYHRAISDALLQWQQANYYTSEIEKICAIAARRDDNG